MGSALVLVLLSTGGFDGIVGSVGQRSHNDSCHAMTQWAQENAADPRARRGLVWCGRLLWADHRLEDARAVLEPVSAGADDDVAMQALATLAEIELTQGRFSRSVDRYRRLAASNVELWRYTGTQGLIEAERARDVWWQAAIGAGLLLAWLAARLAVVRKALMPVPAEVAVLAPLLLLLAAVALTQPAEVARGLAALVLGGTAVAWLNGAYWRARPPKLRSVEALKGLLQGALLLDAVLVSSGLWRPLWMSMTGGFQD